MQANKVEELIFKKLSLNYPNKRIECTNFEVEICTLSKLFPQICQNYIFKSVQKLLIKDMINSNNSLFHLQVFIPEVMFPSLFILSLDSN
jgi:hypothetical protein